MKFVMVVRHKDEEETWDEPYDIPEVKSLEQAEEWGREIIDMFNTSHHGEFEKDREFVSIREAKEDDKGFED